LEEKREVPQRRGVLREEVVFFHKLAQASKDAFFRRIEFYDEECDRVLVFLTNQVGAGGGYRLGVQGALANRVLSPGSQTAAASEDVCGDFGPML